jgi:hypothetical protein
MGHLTIPAKARPIHLIALLEIERFCFSTPRRPICPRGPISIARL